MADARTLQQLPLRAEPAALVAVATGSGAGPSHSGLDTERGAGAGRDGRARHPAPGQAGLRQGQTPRCGAVQSQPDRVALGAQVGSAGHLRATAVRLMSLGPTGLVRSLPFAPTR